MGKVKNLDLSKLLQGLTSIKLGGKPWDLDVSDVTGLVLVGPSCSGKTSLLDAISQSSLCRAGKCSVPLRYITRTQRLNDAPQENVYVSRKEFISMAGDGRIVFHWKKRMDASRQELFGFAAPKPGVLPVYSGNNGLLYNQASIGPAKIMERFLVAGVFAPDEVRKERLLARSPDLVRDKPEEVRYRLMDTSGAMIGKVHIVINNYGPHAKHSARDTIALLRRVWDLL